MNGPVCRWGLQTFAARILARAALVRDARCGGPDARDAKRSSFASREPASSASVERVLFRDWEALDAARLSDRRLVSALLPVVADRLPRLSGRVSVTLSHGGDA